jgi:hypothetical protein
MGMAKLNCWEIKDCGREPGGKTTDELGVCPATVAGGMDGVHGGTNAGRACWAMGGTLCSKEVQGDWKAKSSRCSRCEVMLQIRREEGPGLLGTRDLLHILNKEKLSRARSLVR